MKANRKFWMREDDAVSPVIGTILMVAVTVVLAATVYAFMNGFGDDKVKEPSSAAFKVQALDTDSNGKTDRIKITYITGPTDVPSADVTIALKKASDGSDETSNNVTAAPSTWNPGDFMIYDPSAAGSYFVTVSILDNAVVDRSLNVDE